MRVVGDDDKNCVQQAVKQLEEVICVMLTLRTKADLKYRHEQCLRAMARYLREEHSNNAQLLAMCEQLEAISGTPMEDQRLAVLRRSLVDQGNYEHCEELLVQFEKGPLSRATKTSKIRIQTVS